MTAEQILRTGSKLSRLSDGRPASRTDVDGAETILLLIHGFTAHGDRLEDLGQSLASWSNDEGFLPATTVLVFSYNSYVGIDACADVLRAKLLSIALNQVGRPESKVLDHKLVIIAHSMGGLVGRALACSTPSWVRGLVMLGTPNDGVQTDVTLELFLRVAESVDDAPLPFTRLKSNKSRLQLTKRDVKDTGEPAKYIEMLGRAWAELESRPRTLTISGAKNQLELSGNRILNSLLNGRIQKVMDKATNDGLVAETSVDMRWSVFTRTPPEYTHLNDYPEYPHLNHSNLVENEHLARHIYNWMLVDIQARPQLPSSPAAEAAKRA